ncbi:hypothetical protein GCM10020256_74210 [Streptomyces thermocoprophilus]
MTWGRKAHVGHLVGLVQDGDADLVERAVAAVDEVLQASRRRDDDLGAGAQGTGLLVDRQPADDGGQPQPHGAGVRGQRVGDLSGQFAGGDEDEGERLARFGAAAGGAGQDGQAEGEGLAGAGAAPAEDVTAREGVRQGGALDGERHRHAFLTEGGEHLAGQVQLLEGADRGECGRGRGGEGELACRRRTAAGGVLGAAAALRGALAGGAGAGRSVVRACLCHGEPSLMWHVSRNVRRCGARGIARTSRVEGRGGAVSPKGARPVKSSCRSVHLSV